MGGDNDTTAAPEGNPGRRTVKPGPPFKPGPPTALTPAKPPKAPTPQVDHEGKPYITLSQFLKREHVAGTGGEAKHLARTGTATVNGTPENRPGRKLREGDVVVVAGREHRVTLAR